MGKKVYPTRREARNAKDKQAGLNRIRKVKLGWVIDRVPKRKTNKREKKK